MKNLLLLLALVSLSSLSSCKEEGCNDPDATNYEDSADKDDGSCKYEASMTFVFSEDSQSFVESGGTIRLLIDNQEHTINPFDTDQVLLDQCTNGYVLALGSEKTGLMTYKIEEESLNTSSSLEVSTTISANTCSLVVL